MSYVLKAACSNCGRYGTVDEESLICRHCGAQHEITTAKLQQREHDRNLWQHAQQYRRQRDYIVGIRKLMGWK